MQSKTIMLTHVADYGHTGVNEYGERVAIPMRPDLMEKHIGQFLDRMEDGNYGEPYPCRCFKRLFSFDPFYTDNPQAFTVAQLQASTDPLTRFLARLIAWRYTMRRTVRRGPWRTVATGGYNSFNTHQLSNQFESD